MSIIGISTNDAMKNRIMTNTAFQPLIIACLQHALLPGHVQTPFYNMYCICRLEHRTVGIYPVDYPVNNQNQDKPHYRLVQTGCS